MFGAGLTRYPFWPGSDDNGFPSDRPRSLLFLQRHRGFIRCIKITVARKSRDFGHSHIQAMIADRLQGNIV
jgi:hypothetical protein